MRISKLILLLLAAQVTAFAGADYPKNPIDEALKLAGKNRSEIQKVLDYYQGDPQKLEAAQFLVENMIGKAYKVVTIVDKTGKDVGFDALHFKSLDEAQKALDALEKKHGSLTEKISPIYDLENLKAEFLINHIDFAFKAWRELPWAKNVDWATFKNFILPYRSGKEPAEMWRSELMTRYSWVERQLKDKSNLQEASNVISTSAGQWVTFWDLYYMHPTEQGYSEMKRSQKGRCGDISNFTNTVLRANGIPCTIDYTPYWADTGNNHAWPLSLDASGKAMVTSVSKAAKIYRKTFANHPENLVYQRRKGEFIPSWLDRPDYVDVTKEYLPTTDVALSVLTKAPHAYLCVFNDGEFRPIQWANVKDGKAIFEAMGRDILYLPVSYGKKGIVPVGSPFILSKDGLVEPITAGSTLQTIEVPVKKNDAVFELSIWANGWKKLGSQKSSGGKVAFERVPSGGLYWLVENGSHLEERPFLYVDGKVVYR